MQRMCCVHICHNITNYIVVVVLELDVDVGDPEGLPSGTFKSQLGHEASWWEKRSGGTIYRHPELLGRRMIYLIFMRSIK